MVYASPFGGIYDPGWTIREAEEFVQVLQVIKTNLPIVWRDEDLVRALVPVLTHGGSLSANDWGRLTHNNIADIAAPTRGYRAYKMVANAFGPTGISHHYDLDHFILPDIQLVRNVNELAKITDMALANRAQGVLDALKRLGIDPRIIGNDTSDKLTAFFVDGTYNFTYILFPTAVLQNGAAGSGTCVISSNYDVKTQLLDKKSLINNFSDPETQIILQSFDINNNSIVMDTYGSSLSGQFGFKEDGSALNTIDTGYDATYGTFTTFYRFYIKTQIGFLISNYNRETDELHSVWFYSIVPKATNAAPEGPAGRH